MDHAAAILGIVHTLARLALCAAAEQPVAQAGMDCA